MSENRITPADYVSDEKYTIGTYIVRMSRPYGVTRWVAGKMSPEDHQYAEQLPDPDAINADPE